MIKNVLISHNEIKVDKDLSFLNEIEKDTMNDNNEFEHNCGKHSNQKNTFTNLKITHKDEPKLESLVNDDDNDINN